MSKKFTELSAKEMKTTNGGGFLDDFVRDSAAELRMKFSLIKPALSVFYSNNK